MQPADFYTGIVAELYEPLKSFSPDPAPYARFIEQFGQPALELGCGDGEPLLDLRRRGFDVEGIDSSPDMLDRCRRKAAEADLQIVVHRQAMEDLDLPRRYRSIFLTGPTFILLPDDNTALRVLCGIHAHLHAEGAALVPLYIPPPTPPAQFGQVREARAEDGTVLRYSVIAESRDESARTQTATTRYEKHAAGVDTVIERPWVLHWHTQAGFADLATDAGFTATIISEAGHTPPDDSREFTFLLRPV